MLIGREAPVHNMGNGTLHLPGVIVHPDCWNATLNASNTKLGKPPLSIKMVYTAFEGKPNLFQSI